MKSTNKKELVELHSHLGSAVSPAILWSIAHRQGIKLPSKDYWDFEDMITMSGDEKNKNLEEMDHNFFHWTELIQSSPDAIEESVKATIAGGYRKSNITIHELRFNPMKRNRGGERDLDHTIMSAIWGAEKAMLEYPQVKAGIILMLDRNFSLEQNQIIIDKAIKYKHQGIIGVDVAGPNNKKFEMAKLKPLFERAKNAGLGITIHTGEEKQLDEMHYVVNEIRPHRIGHGVQSAYDPGLMRQLVKHKITLEVGPSSNLRNTVVKNMGELKKVIQTLLKNKVRLAIWTDGPEMYITSIKQEQELLIKHKIMSQKQLDESTKIAKASSFIK